MYVQLKRNQVLPYYPKRAQRLEEMKECELQCSAAASGWAGWALAHPEFGSSVNPITTRGADYAHHITASPPGFENPAAYLSFTLLPFAIDQYFC